MEKLHLCQKLLSKHLTEIIITEIWQAQDYALFTPLVVARSTPTPRINASRGTGGLLILTRPCLKDDFQVLDTTTHSITFRYKSYTMHAVYLPSENDLRPMLTILTKDSSFIPPWRPELQNVPSPIYSS
jgi:hypothetical protein